MPIVSCLPKPKKVVIGGARSSKFEFTALEFTGREDKRVAEYLHSCLSESKLGQISVCIENNDFGFPSHEMDESYSIEIHDHIAIQAATSWGAIRGIATLYQLNYTDGLTARISIADSPRFAWRGLLIDAARHFIPVDDLKRVLNGMALLKLNVLHLHLSDDQAFRFESLAFPGLASMECYNQADLAELVLYASARGIRVIPELDVPGHTTSWLVNYPEWGLQDVELTTRFGVHKACLDPSSEKLYQDLETLFSEVAQVFPDEFFHIGGDEVHPEWWDSDDRVQAFARAQGLKSVPEIQNYFSGRIFQILSRLGKKPIAWDEVLHEGVSDFMIQNWRGSSTRDRALKKGLDCIVSSGFYLDLFYPADIHYRFDPEANQSDLFEMEDQLKNDSRLAHVSSGLEWTDQWRLGSVDLESDGIQELSSLGNVVGGEACLWGELVTSEVLFPRLWSRLPAVAERLWSAKEVKDVADFYKRFSILRTCKELEWEKDEEKGLIAAGLSRSQVDVARIFEPAKWYFRLLGEELLNARIEGSEMPVSRPYNTESRLNRVVDFLSPESLSARQLVFELDRGSLIEKLGLWKSQDPELWPSDMQKAIAVLIQISEIILDYLLDGVRLKLEVIGLLRELYVPQGEYMVSCIPPLISWLESDERG